jgi:folate-binding protein YgfZ
MAHSATAELIADYGDASTEHWALTHGAALVDRSQVGRLHISGTDALDMLNRLSTNKLEVLPFGESAPTVITSPKGRVVDLLMVGARTEHLLCLTSPGRQQAIADWIDFYTFVDDIALQDVTAATAQFTVAGPTAAALLSAAGGLAGWLPLHQLRDAVVGEAGVVLWHTLSSGTESYEVIVQQEQAPIVWRSLLAAGAVPAGQTAWEAFRTANGAPAYGAEYGEETNPLESRLRGAISFDKGCYIGQEVVARLDTYKKVQRRLMAASLSGPAGPGDILLADGHKAGVLSSVARVPQNGAYVALALVNITQSVAGYSLTVAGSDITATLSEPAYALATEPAQT